MAAVATAEPLVLLRRDPKEEAYITQRLGGPGLPQAQTKARRRRQLFLRFELPESCDHISRDFLSTFPRLSRDFPRGKSLASVVLSTAVPLNSSTD